MNLTTHLNQDAMEDEGKLILQRMREAMAKKFAKKKEGVQDPNAAQQSQNTTQSPDKINA